MFSVLVPALFSAVLSDAPPAESAGDAQCRDGGGQGWRKNESHATSSCNMPVLDVGSDESSLSAIARRCAQATTPLLIRGLFDRPDWRGLLETLGNRTKLVGTFGHESVRVSVADLLKEGPEETSEKLNGKRLAFMRDAWAAEGDSTFRRGLWQQVQAREPRPWTTVGDFVVALGEDDVPQGAYVFHNVSDSVVLADVLEPLRALWRNVTLAQFSPEQQSRRVGTSSLDAMVRLGVGGSGSGTGFHGHEFALNFAFAGRKRWLVTLPDNGHIFNRNFRFKGRKRWRMFGPDELLHKALASVAFQESWRELGEQGETWDCTQQPGEIVFVPETFLHATINLDESLSLAVQCGVKDPRQSFSKLNSLIAHASEGFSAAFGPCGSRWKSPWQGMVVDQALREGLPEVLRLESVDLNSPDTDGHAPVDVATWFGSVRVAEVLTSLGAIFLPRHSVDARRHGHEELAAFIDVKVETSETG